MLACWAEVTKEMYPDFQHNIPNKSEMSISKLAKGGLLTSDTCNTARKIRLLLCEKIEEAAREKGLPEDEINVLEGGLLEPPSQCLAWRHDQVSE